jgi:hypothetical protein
MALNVKELAVNVAVTATWTQMQHEGSNYEVPTGYRVDVILMAATNLGANSAVVDFAFSADGTIGDVERRLYPRSLTTAEPYLESDGKFAMVAGKRIYVRATGTTPNVTFVATIVERPL